MAKQRVAPNPNVGKNLLFLMEQKHNGMASQQAIAKATGVGQTTVGRILRSEVQPGSENLQSIANAMLVPLQALYLPPERFKAEFERGLVKPLSEIPIPGKEPHALIITKPLTVGTMLQAIGRMTRDLPAQRKKAIDALVDSPTAELADSDAAFIDDLAGGATVPVHVPVAGPEIWETARSMAANWPEEEVKPFLLEFIERVERAQVDKFQLAKMASTPARVETER